MQHHSTKFKCNIQKRQTYLTDRSLPGEVLGAVGLKGVTLDGSLKVGCSIVVWLKQDDVALGEKVAVEHAIETTEDGNGIDGGRVAFSGS